MMALEFAAFGSWFRTFGQSSVYVHGVVTITSWKKIVNLILKMKIHLTLSFGSSLSRYSSWPLSLLIYFYFHSNIRVVSHIFGLGSAPLADYIWIDYH